MTTSDFDHGHAPLSSPVSQPLPPSVRRPVPPVTGLTAHLQRWRRRMLLPLADLVEPLCCAGCGRHGTAVCDICRAAFTPGSTGPVVVRTPIDPGVPVRATAAYLGPARRLLSQWKDADRRDVTPVLASALAGSVAALAPRRPLLLVPVPSTPGAIRRRGRDVLGELAQAAADELGPGFSVLGALRSDRAVRDQSGLDAAQRRHNVAGAFRPLAGVETLLPGAEVIIVDDVVTTGATLSEAARVLALLGARLRGVAVVCATPRRLPESGRHAHPLCGCAEVPDCTSVGLPNARASRDLGGFRGDRDHRPSHGCF